ncbi:hypothetical protein IQ07DRAFT_656484 [Pyrenochaeta sp. DS3sAY3a]|nr:hypothetical protein IQ07DRAFT_656484 [Pyrenochaeta sp. DS3sAY3a]
MSLGRVPESDKPGYRSSSGSVTFGYNPYELRPSNTSAASLPQRPNRTSSIYSSLTESTESTEGSFKSAIPHRDYHSEPSEKDFCVAPLSVASRQDSQHPSISSLSEKRQGRDYTYQNPSNRYPERRNPNNNNPSLNTSYPDPGKPSMPVSLSQPGRAPKNCVCFILIGLLSGLAIAIATLIMLVLVMLDIQGLKDRQPYMPVNHNPTSWPIFRPTPWLMSNPTEESDESRSASDITSTSTSTTTSTITRVGEPSTQSDSKYSTLPTTFSYQVSEHEQSLARREEALVQSYVPGSLPTTTELRVTMSELPTTTSQLPTTTRSRYTYTSTITSTIYSNPARPRYKPLFSWTGRKRRTIFDWQGQPGPTSEGDKAAENTNIATITTAAEQTAVPQAQKRSRIVTTLIRRQTKQTYWEAYSLLRQQASMLCIAATTYLATPVKNETDVQMANQVRDKLCNTLEKSFSMVPQGQKCDTKKEWTDLLGELDLTCQSARIGAVIVPSLDVLCALAITLKQDVVECTGDASLASGLALSTLPRFQLLSSASTTIPSNSASTTLKAYVSSLTTQNSNHPGSPTLLQPPVTSTPPSSLSPPASNPSAPTGPSPIFSAPAGPTPTIPAPTVPASTPNANPHACPTPLPQLTFSTPAKWSAPILTSIPPWTLPISYQGLTTKPGLSPSAGIPCGYTSSSSTLIVPATTHVGDMTYYTGSEAFEAFPACPDTPKLVPREALAAIGWEVFDFGRGGSVSGKSKFCGRRIRAWCGGEGEGDADGEGEGERKEVSLWVRDRCAGCRPQDLDVLADVFPFCAHLDVGRARVRWVWAED